jgi:hypothetical protein
MITNLDKILSWRDVQSCLLIQSCAWQCVSAVDTGSMTGCQTSKLGIFLEIFILQCCQLVRYNIDGLWMKYEPGTQVKSKINIKLSLGMPWRQTCESMEVWLHSAQNEVQWLPWHHRYSVPGVLWVWGWGWVVARANWTFWRREKSLLLGTTQFLCPSACSAVTVPGVLFGRGEKCVAVALCPSQFAHGLCWNDSCGCVVCGAWLAMA